MQTERDTFRRSLIYDLASGRVILDATFSAYCEVGAFSMIYILVCQTTQFILLLNLAMDEYIQQVLSRMSRFIQIRGRLLMYISLVFLSRGVPRGTI